MKKLSSKELLSLLEADQDKENQTENIQDLEKESPATKDVVEDEPENSESFGIDDVKAMRDNYVDILNKQFSKVKVQNSKGQTIATTLSFAPGEDSRIKIEGNKGQFSIVISKGTSGQTLGSKVLDIAKALNNNSDNITPGNNNARW